MRPLLPWALLFVLAPAPARAADAQAAPAPVAAAPPAPDPRAEQRKAAGDEAMGTLRYADALVAYREAYAIHAQPALLYNIGRALQALGRFPEALDSLEAFRAQAPPELLAKVPKLEALIAEVRARVSELTLTVNVDGARVLIRRELVGTTPLPKALRLNAGPAALEVRADGYVPYSTTLDLTPAGTLGLPIQLAPLSDRALLVVRSPVRGARVLVDGRPAGTVPTETVVKAGQHTIVVRQSGYDEGKSVAFLKAGERKVLDVPLAETTPITATWWFWTGLGVVVAGGVAVTAALVTERSPSEGSIPPGKLATALTLP